MNATGAGPLDDVEVVEIGQYIAGPYATEVLGDLGARVIKVEPPHGDGIRNWGPHPGGESAPFLMYNRNKECVEIDLRSEAGRAMLEGLIARADVVVENNRPGVLSRYGFDGPSVRMRHPRLIYCSITGYGADAPLAGRPGFDLVIQGLTGLMSVTGHEGGELAKVGVPIVDGTASLHATTAVLAALHDRARTGEGATIDISLQASTLTWMMLLASKLFVTGEEPRRLGSAHPLAAPYQAFRTADGHMTIAAGNERQWQRLCEALELDLLDDDRFRVNATRAENQVELAELIEERLAARPRADWIALLSEAGVPCGPVYTLQEALSDEAVDDRGLVVAYDHPRAGEMRTIASPIVFDRFGAPFRRPPLQGEHTEAIAAELDAAGGLDGLRHALSTNDKEEVER